jgi:hypothetical protein
MVARIPHIIQLLISLWMYNWLFDVILHTFEEFISYASIAILSCILVKSHEHTCLLKFCLRLLLEQPHC